MEEQNGSTNGHGDGPHEVIPANVHDIIKTTDVWFDYGYSELNKEAIEQARTWASAGLPRFDVADDALPPEIGLAQRGQALFSAWADRVQNKLRSAIQARVQRTGELLSSYEHDLNDLEKSLVDIRNVSEEIPRTEEAASGRQAQVGMRRFMSKFGFWLLMVILVCVDWVANVPVFHELLPQDPGSEEVLRGLMADTEASGMWGGFERMAIRMLFSPDVSLLAVGLIAALVFLAEVAGKSFRRVTVLRPSDFPGAARAVEAERRQFRATWIASTVGVICLLTVLVAARYQLKSATENRVQQAQAEVTRLTTDLENYRRVGDTDGIFQTEQRLESAYRTRDQRAERADYAATISAMNWPILFLNLVVALTAAIAGFLYSADTLSSNFEDPRLVGLRNRVAELRKALIDRKAALSRTEAQVLEQFSTIEHFLQSQPLAAWSVKADRLRSVIQAFRSENAQVRGVDPVNIASFRKPAVIEFTPVDVRIAEPEELKAYRARFGELRSRAQQLIAGINAETRSGVIV